MISAALKNFPGWRTKRKIVVLESDDWGSIRMPSRNVYESLKQKGVPIDSNRYLKYDTLAAPDDLSALFEVLQSVRDKNGQPAKMTAVSVVANPDFQRIKDSDYSQYHYELFTKTLERYDRAQSFSLWKEGMVANLFHPEFHGREHLNITRWLYALQAGDTNMRTAFDYGVFGISPVKKTQKSYMPAFDLDHQGELTLQKQVVTDGLRIFHELFGYGAKHFTPPNGPLNDGLNDALHNGGIKYIQTARTLYSEPLGEGRFRKRFRYLGKKNDFGQLYFIRNCVFEPNEKAEFDWVVKCKKELEWIFRMNKPAIITSHRVNYIGSIEEKNRTESLRKLKNLLEEITKTWPDVEFLFSNELGDLMMTDK